MNVAIIGTRGIPNNYGGFEQLAEYLSLGLNRKGHRVTVYNTHDHPFKDNTWNNIRIIHCYNPEPVIGTAGQFIYDLNCILSTRRHHFDIILNLGYTSSSVWSRLFPKRPVLITNMDGLEWKRSKYSARVQRFLRYAEKLAVKHSDVLVADSVGIQNYLSESYKVQSHFIAYGADCFDTPDAKLLKEFGAEPQGYNMLIARMEPENNLEMILDGMQASATEKPFLVIGNYKNKFGQYLKQKYLGDRRIVFMGPIYNVSIINNLRYFSHLYLHGHSVGGTNPSLLEAMGCQCLIAAHSNSFNRYVLGNDAFYFESAGHVRSLLDMEGLRDNNRDFITNNFEKIKQVYSWDNIVKHYEQLMLSSLT